MECNKKDVTNLTRCKRCNKSKKYLWTIFTLYASVLKYNASKVLSYNIREEY